MIRVSVHELWHPEDKNQDRSGYEATDMCPERDATALGANGPDTAQQLEQKPITEHPDSGYREGGYKKAQKYKHMHLYFGVKQNIVNFNEFTSFENLLAIIIISYKFLVSVSLFH